MRTYTVALAGNPNTGKSTLFNALTGLKQHTGNWSGKTVSLASGHYEYKDARFQFIDLPGTYSLFSNSADEEVARDYIIFEKPDVTLLVLDATALERSLNLALQVLEMTDRVIVCLNLMDEAKKKGIQVNARKLADQLGVPVIPISARNNEGLDVLSEQLLLMSSGQTPTKPYRMKYNEQLEAQISGLESQLRDVVGDEYPARWLAIRFLDGDRKLIATLKERLKAADKGGISLGTAKALGSSNSGHSF
ncbi:MULTISPECIES: FeoB small GTPase domain-containing protein [Paenibacillus]|uniref:FeoB small GTPase domain-containing protein n=1 Tax=Paenibacillus TaxID=44249 RepID=UPI000BBDC9CE|nr:MULTISPECIES: FeoB small GTPase domain-containing protein [Paenibacillus]PCL92310.1 iron transporter FeoB [Paenibacillus lautus]WFB60146.1 FeoB small GTPase domain-containing protein [Paenibacillus sp. BR1-192]